MLCFPRQRREYITDKRHHYWLHTFRDRLCEVALPSVVLSWKKMCGSHKVSSVSMVKHSAVHKMPWKWAQWQINSISSFLTSLLPISHPTNSLLPSSFFFFFQNWNADHITPWYLQNMVQTLRSAWQDPAWHTPSWPLYPRLPPSPSTLYSPLLLRLSTRVPLSHHTCPSFHVKHVLFMSSPEKSYVSFIFTGDILCYLFLEDFADIVSSPHPHLTRFSSSINTCGLHLPNCILTICFYPLTVSHLRGGLFLYSLSPDSG